MKRIFMIIAVNILLFAVLCFAIEATFRIFDIKRAAYGKTIFGSKFAPYVMFINQPNWKDCPYSVFDQFKKVFEYGKRTTNNWGFPTTEDFDFAGPPIEKKPTEKLVIFTGGSAAAGAGATADDKLITAQMERVLNTSQKTYHYKVVNFANGGWIASQEFIGLALWGRAYNPDWVIAMDGRNDIAIAFLNCQGAGYPHTYHQMDSYIYGYMQAGQGTSFYRGWLENLIIKYSVAYRTITGKLYVVNNQQLVDYKDFAFVVNPIKEELKGSQLDRIVRFYTNSLENITGLFHNAKYILSLQPMYHDHARLFGVSEKDVKATAEQLRNADCGLKEYGNALTVFYNYSLKSIQKMMERYKGKRQIYFYNMSEIFPSAGNNRLRFFLDEVHMYDSGQELVGVFYAYKILASDFPGMAAKYESELKTQLASLIAQNAQK